MRGVVVAFVVVWVWACLFAGAVLGGDRDGGGDGGAADLRSNPDRVMLTEVLFHVPTASSVDAGPGVVVGDASGDGVRSATGDEFVELWNPTGEAVDLEGWSIVSRLAWHAEEASAKKGVRFVFPAFELPAGEVVVVFNGYRTLVAGGAEVVGTEERSARERHGGFGGAWVFVMSMNSRNRALSNSGDFALLLDGSGEPVEGVVWGEPELGPPVARVEGADGEVRERYALHEVGEDPGGSFERVLDEDGLAGGFVRYGGVDGDRLFSPGVVLEVEGGAGGVGDGRAGSGGGG